MNLIVHLLDPMIHACTVTMATVMNHTGVQQEQIVQIAEHVVMMVLVLKIQNSVLKDIVLKEHTLMALAATIVIGV